MFTRRKRNYRRFVFSALAVTICVLAVALLWPAGEEPQENVRADAATEAEANAGGGAGEQHSAADLAEKIDSLIGRGEANRADGEENGGEDDEDAEDGEKNDGEVAEGGQKTYYLLRREGENIAVFFCGEGGSEILLETTDIPYGLLPPEDQSAFDKGVKVATQEELFALLQDFES